MGQPEPRDLEALRDLAVDLAWRAGRRTLAYFQAGVEVEAKADGTPVTRADREAEALLRREIRSRYPDDALRGEEYDDEAGSTGWTWVLDPIDGTKSFVHGVPFYSVLVAVCEGTRPVVGVIHLPGLGETVAAHRGGGCWWNGRRARVSETPRVAEALVVTSDFPGSEQAHTPTRLYDAARLRRTWGDAYGYAMVATGRADVMIDPEVAPWDVAAVQPVVEEAGGRFTDLGGTASPWNGNAVATNGHLHDEVLRLVGPA
ncbi:MAG: inositol monophosphatase family protein [Acidobacteriota bacterium]